jgi:hypothetical protein
MYFFKAVLLEGWMTQENRYLRTTQLKIGGLLVRHRQTKGLETDRLDFRASAYFLVDGKDFTEPGENLENGFDL